VQRLIQAADGGVGVIAGERITGVGDEISAGMYVSNQQSPTYAVNLIVQSGIPPESLQRAVRSAVDSVNKDQAITDIRSLEQIKSASMGGRRIPSVLLGVFGAVALILAGIGIYGVISYSVAQRTREIGIRVALGASERSLLRLVLDRGVVLTGVGLAIGLAGAFGLTRLMASMLFGVGARDPMTMASVAFVLAGVAMLASYVPARRAMKVDPIVALRYE